MITLLMTIHSLTFGKNFSNVKHSKIMNTAFIIDILGVCGTTLWLVGSY